MRSAVKGYEANKQQRHGSHSGRSHKVITVHLRAHSFDKSSRDLVASTLISQQRYTSTLKIQYNYMFKEEMLNVQRTKQPQRIKKETSVASAATVNPACVIRLNDGASREDIYTEILKAACDSTRIWKRHTTSTCLCGGNLNSVEHLACSTLDRPYYILHAIIIRMD